MRAENVLIPIAANKAKVRLLLQTLSLLFPSSFAFASARPSIVSVASDPHTTPSRLSQVQRRNDEGNHIDIMHLDFDPQRQRNCPLPLAFHSRQRGQRSVDASHAQSCDRYRYTQPRHSRVLPLATIPHSRREAGDGEPLSAPSVFAIVGNITKNVATSEKARGRATLLLVAFLYGTLNVALRAVYTTEGPPAASVLSLVRQLLTVASFVPIFAVARAGNASQDEEESGPENQQIDETTVRPMWTSALELAFWNFGAQGLINAGLLSSPAARASFLTQTSVVMTPLISAFAGESIKSLVWGGCGLALFGLFLISTSASADVINDAASTFNQGDAAILLGALSWSVYIFRTSRLARSYPELELQFAKSAFLVVMYGGWFFVAAASTLASTGASLASAGWAEALVPLWAGWNSPVVWLLLAYSAVGPGAVADLLQQQGQRETSASESNIILCMESVFAAACAFAVLGEVSSTKEMAGGLLIVAAAILASK